MSKHGIPRSGIGSALRGRLKGLRTRSMMYHLMTRFICCVAVLLLLATPLFYLLTKNFYAEDMADLIEAVRLGHPAPVPDLESDILRGVVIQFALIVTVLGVAVVLTIRLISRRLWRPFDRTLAALEGFKLEKGHCPSLPGTRVREFNRLNETLERLMRNSLHSYRVQKEFTENASHELQTPLAVMRSRLDLLSQQPDITEQQAEIIQSLYAMNRRLSRLSRNLLLLAGMENRQYRCDEPVDMVPLMEELLPNLMNLAGGIKIRWVKEVSRLLLPVNAPLVEHLINNLVVNAIRHNMPGGDVEVTLSEEALIVSNTSDEGPLDGRRIFNRFYRPSERVSGTGLGLAIVKEVCAYHGWAVHYEYRDGRHVFVVKFRNDAREEEEA